MPLLFELPLLNPLLLNLWIAQGTVQHVRQKQSMILGGVRKTESRNQSRKKEKKPMVEDLRWQPEVVPLPDFLPKLLFNKTNVQDLCTLNTGLRGPRPVTALLVSTSGLRPGLPASSSPVRFPSSSLNPPP